MQEDTGSVQSLDTQSSSGLVTGSGSVSSNQPEKVERSFTRSEVAKITDIQSKQAAKDAVEEYKNSERERLSKESSTINNSVSHDDLGKIADEAAARAFEKRDRHERERIEKETGDRLLAEINTKMAAAKDKYPNFDGDVRQSKMRSFPSTLFLANMLDNTADIMHSLMERPDKLASIELLSDRDPELALDSLKRLSKSIQDNENAKNAKLPKPPLTQMRSTKNTVDSGNMTAKDYRELYKTTRI